MLEAYRQNIISIEQLKEQIDTIRKSKEDLEKTIQEMKMLLQQQDGKTEVGEAIDYIKKLKLPQQSGRADS